MIKQRDSNNSLKEDKYKILSYSILLGNTDNIDNDKKELEETARYLEQVNETAYEEILASYDYTTTTLEEEKSRLEDLINFINERVKERDKFNDTYFQVMHSYIDDLMPIKDSDSLDYYKNRLKNITEYLANVEEINLLNDELTSLNDELKSKKENESNSKIVNKKLESSLLEEFTKVIADDEYYTKLNYVDIDSELINLENNIIEKKNTLDTFVSSYEALEKSGISGSEREEYRSYVRDVENDYYVDAEKKYLLNIYKLILNTETDYDSIYNKREKINKILEDREELRKKLHISKEDNLIDFITVHNEQFAIIKSQKYVLEDINRLTLEISKLKNKLEVLNTRNDRKEIVDILDEYKVVDLKTIDSNDEKSLVETIYEPNMVVSVDDSSQMNLDEVLKTAKVVMKKVVMAIEPKKFTRKKTAKELQNNGKPVEEKREELNILDKPFKEEDKPLVENDNTFIDVSDPFVQEKMENVVFDNVDPFLDDNNIVHEEETLSNMPIIDNIGSVRPTTKLKEIEKINEENTNIVLPTMGLTDNQENNINLSSENYLGNNETASD